MNFGLDGKDWRANEKLKKKKEAKDLLVPPNVISRIQTTKVISLNPSL